MAVLFPFARIPFPLRKQLDVEYMKAHAKAKVGCRHCHGTGNRGEHVNAQGRKTIICRCVLVDIEPMQKVEAGKEAEVKA